MKADTLGRMVRISWSSVLLGCVACAAGGGGAKTTVASGNCGVETASCEQSKPSFASAQAAIKQRCTSCHSPDGSAGEEHDFTVEATIKSHQKKIVAEVASCSMPPTGATPLKDDERAAIECWASAQ